MKLYWAPQTRSIQALWALEESGLTYERVLIDVRAGAQNSPRYRAINPMRKVPALEDDGTIVTESAAICAHVADRAPKADLAPPVGDSRRGAWYRWLFFAPGCIEPAFVQRFTGLTVEKSTAAWGSYDLVIDTLDGAVKKGPWILGERFSAADIMIGSGIRFGLLFKIVEPRPAFTEYVARCDARTAFKRAQAIDAAGR
jgi:glutathione S-transferase